LRLARIAPRNRLPPPVPWLALRKRELRGVSRDQLQVYLDEFVFRHNRCQTPMAAFQTLLGLGTAHSPVPYTQIKGASDHSRQIQKQ